ncbi:MAG: Ferredoxin, 2Fe-2S, partial [uncultured Rubellimicrobium sp.]
GADYLCRAFGQGACRGRAQRPHRHGRRTGQRHPWHRGGLRRGLRLFDLPCLRRPGLGGKAAQEGPDGGGHARFRLRARSRAVPPDLPDQGDARPRRAAGADARKADL